MRPPCEFAPFIGLGEMSERIARADIVITHAGNTVRLVQRAGKVPIAVARESVRGEMANDHQVEYLARESSGGRVVALSGSLDDLAAVVDHHLDRQRDLVSRTAELPDIRAADVRARIDEALDGARTRPASVGTGSTALVRDPLRRYGWAFGQLQRRTGNHLDVGVGDGRFIGAVHDDTELFAVGCDPHAGYLADLKLRRPGLAAVRSDGLPFRGAAFDSVTALDVLEHVGDERRTLREIYRVLRPGGLLLVTVPARHAFSFMDPDNAKLRMPRVHGAVYRARFGRRLYEARFVDRTDGLRGDMAWDRREHTNYEPAVLLHMLTDAGFIPVIRDGANLVWRLLQVPQLLAPSRAARVLDVPIRWDGSLFHRANLFLAAFREDGTGQ